MIVEKTESSFGAYVPDLPGCVAVAESRDEVLGLIREAISSHLEDMIRSGQPIPSPTTTGEFVEVEAA